jgi:metal-responsive CopG/Arc/MetJ family transcriptional regulator
MRLSDELRAAIDRWAAEKEMSRSEAIRALIEQGLKK